MSTATAPAPTVEKPSVAHLPYRPESASAARRLVRGKLAEWGLDELIDDAELIISELVANAAKTGCFLRMTVEITRITAGAVRISVTDGSRVLPVLMDAGLAAEGGRGLALVHRLTKGQWGVTLETLGKTVHADLRMRGAS
ncbi:ATP-binding protein [Kitasatospora aureofaciens]|uniref:ATP-binding protein n=1 Tax=Kitasatospora aureofaciens TaxID=1894 RepID=UPI001C482402|nr:ATP-binding protein [Kitasatospora aureofaciens]MBV6696963.1 ATP-binding protein [Kitasatospora aureofaciens]